MVGEDRVGSKECPSLSGQRINGRRDLCESPLRGSGLRELSQSTKIQRNNDGLIDLVGEGYRKRPGTGN